LQLVEHDLLNNNSCHKTLYFINNVYSPRNDSNKNTRNNANMKTNQTKKQYVHTNLPINSEETHIMFP